MGETMLDSDPGMDQDEDGEGLQVTFTRVDCDVAFSVSRNVPGRKKPCLMIQKGNCLYKVASFNNEEAAARFEQFMENFLEPWLEDKVEN